MHEELDENEESIVIRHRPSFAKPELIVNTFQDVGRGPEKQPPKYSREPSRCCPQAGERTRHTDLVEQRHIASRAEKDVS